MAEKISVQIALDGGAEVEKQLVDIGKAGTKAFDGVNEAGAAAADGIAKAGEASQTTGEELNKVQGSADKAAESLSKISLESIKTSAEIAKVGLEITKLGVEIGLAVTRHKTLAQSLFSLVTGANTAVKALSLVAPELTAIAAAAAPVALAVAGLVVGFEAIEKAATAAAKGYEAINNSLQTLAANTGQTFSSLQQGQAAFEQLGISAEKYRGVITKLNEIDVGAKIKKSTDDMLEAEKKLIELRQKSEGRELTFAEVGRLQEINKLLGTVADSEQKLGDVRDAAAKTSANSLQTLIPLIAQIVAGSKDIKFDGLVTGESKINAVAIAMKNAAESGKTAGEVLVKFIANADRASAIEVGAKFGITEEDVARIRNLGGQLGVVDEIWKRIQGAGVLIPPESAAAFERMRVSIQGVDSAWARLKQALSSTFFATEAAKISGDLNMIKAAVLNFTAATVEAFNRAGAGMAQGFQAGIQTTIQELAAIGGALTAMGSAVALVFTNPLQALQALGNGIALVASQLGGFLVSITGITWDPIGAGVEAWNAIVGAVQGAGNAITTFVSSLGTITWDAISSVGVAAWNALTGAIGGAASAVANFFSNLASGAWDKVKALLGVGGGGGSAPGKASGGVIGGRGTGTSDSNLAWLSRGEYIMPAGAVRKPGVLSFLEAMRRSGGIPGFAGGGIVGGGGTETVTLPADQMLSALQQNTEAINSQSTVIIELGNIIAGLAQTVDNLVQTVGGLAETVGGLAQQQGKLVSSISDALQNLPKKALGGLLGGRGTGTSDSNLAWVSRGEHIMPARAVAQPGVLAFLEALRRSGGNLSRVLDGMGRFALGGMVPRAMPAFASGGLAGGMSNITIQFPGLPPISGLRASSGVVDELHRAAALAQVRSGGRKPSRYS